MGEWGSPRGQRMHSRPLLHSCRRRCQLRLLLLTCLPTTAAASPLQNIVAVVLRVDSPGGDALASDLMWREIQELSKVGGGGEGVAGEQGCCTRCGR